jgi:hypothetical protein
MQLGEYWRQSMEPNQTPAQANNRRELLQDIASREQLAETALRPLMERGVQEGIDSCIARGSRSLGFDIPDGIEGTDAYRRFRSWAADNGLMVHVMHDTKLSSPLLTLTPAQA